MADSSAIISWRSIALGSLLMNLVAIAAVATVAAVNDAGALNTVALSLAVIAFVCQLVIYTVQTWQSGAQLKLAESLNAETLRALSEARVRIESTHHMVETHNTEMLRLTAVKQATEDMKVVASGGEVRPSQPLIPTNPSSIVTAASGHSAGVSIPVTAGPVSEETRRMGSFFPFRWPANVDVIEKHLETLETAASSSRFNLAVGLADDTQSRIANVKPGLMMNEKDQVLIDNGLLVEAPPDTVRGRTTRRVRPTQLGREVGAIFFADWPPPDRFAHLADRLWTMREDLDAVVHEDMARYRDLPAPSHLSADETEAGSE